MKRLIDFNVVFKNISRRSKTTCTSERRREASWKKNSITKPPPIKTDKEKEDLRKKMKDKYETKYDIPERILFMALESVLFDEEQANNLM